MEELSQVQEEFSKLVRQYEAAGRSLLIFSRLHPDDVLSMSAVLDQFKEMGTAVRTLGEAITEVRTKALCIVLKAEIAGLRELENDDGLDQEFIL